MTITAPAIAVERVPFNTLAIPFALCGLASVWTAGSGALGITPAISGVLWLIAAAALVVLLVEHTRRGRVSQMTLVQQLRHPGQGPLAALVPIVGMMLGSQLARVLPVAGDVLVVISAVTSLAFTLWLAVRWLRGHFEFSFVHGGYLLPTAAASFIMSIVTVRMGVVGFALGMFVAGIILWLVFAGLIAVRLLRGNPWPDPLVPTQSMLLAPPSIAMVAWAEIFGPRADLLFTVLAVSVLLMLLLQLFWLPRYTKTSYSLGFWAFTFPTAATSLAIMIWMGVMFPQWLDVATIAVLVLMTGLVISNSVRSLRLLSEHRRGLRAAEHDLTLADEVVGN